MAGARCSAAAIMVKIQVFPFTPTLLRIRTFSLLAKLSCRAKETDGPLKVEEDHVWTHL